MPQPRSVLTQATAEGVFVDSALPGWMDLAGHDALLQALMIVAGTFILEDATTVLSAIAVQAGAVDMRVALIALYAGVILGDIGLYGLGYAAARMPMARRWAATAQAGRRWLRTNVLKTVFISRFIPGARLPTYTACGFFGAGLLRFTLAAVVATLIWTSLLFAVSLAVGQVLLSHLGAWRWAGAAGFAVTIVLIGHRLSRQRSAAP
jgi:membrane protein DedA with SNARE-associated domain